MKDPMEDLFRNQRDAFDDKTPPDRVWARIERNLFGTSRVSLWNSVVIWRVAALVLLGLSAYLFIAPRLPLRVEDALAQKEFIEVESFYAAQITEKASMIQRDDGFAEDGLTADFEKLEAMYAVLSEELKKHPSQKVKDAMVLNMLVRIDLLNAQLQRQEEARNL
jgi:hypothetical protein